MQSAHMARKDATPLGSFQKFRGHRVVWMCVQLNRCCVMCVSVLQRGQYGEVCVFVSTV